MPMRCGAESGSAGVPQCNRVQLNPLHTADRAQRLRGDADPRQDWCPGPSATPMPCRKTPASHAEKHCSLVQSKTLLGHLAGAAHAVLDLCLKTVSCGVALPARKQAPAATSRSIVRQTGLSSGKTDTGLAVLLSAPAWVADAMVTDRTCMQETVDKAAVKAVFPYGRICCVDVVEGGLRANSGIAVAALGANTPLLVRPQRMQQLKSIGFALTCTSAIVLHYCCQAFKMTLAIHSVHR